MKEYAELANSVRYSKKGEGYTIAGKHSALFHIGTGRSACAFRIRDTDKVIKIYYPDFSYIAHEETEIYKKLGSLSSFPALHESGENYIVIDYIQGMTFFQCLTRGERINNQTILEVDRVLKEVSRLHLNPSDIHLHNLMLTPEGRVKIIDPARFNQEKDCTQWNDLKSAYHKYYVNRFFPKRLPAVILDSISHLYKLKLLKI